MNPTNKSCEIFVAGETLWADGQQERQRAAAHQLRVESVPPEPDADALGKPRNLPHGESETNFRESSQPNGGSLGAGAMAKQ